MNEFLGVLVKWYWHGRTELPVAKPSPVLFCPQNSKLTRLLKYGRKTKRKRGIWKARKTSSKTKIHWKNERNERSGRKRSKKYERKEGRIRMTFFFRVRLSDVNTASMQKMWRSKYKWKDFTSTISAGFFFILANSVYKMWIIQEPIMLELWNKLHFEEKNGEYILCLKYSVPIFVE